MSEPNIDPKVKRARSLLRVGVEAYSQSVKQSITEVKSAAALFSEPVYIKNAAPIEYERYATVCPDNATVSIILSRLCDERGAWLFQNDVTREEAVKLMRENIDWSVLSPIMREINEFDGLTASRIKIKLGTGKRFKDLSEEEQDVWRDYLFDNGIIEDRAQEITDTETELGIEIMGKGTPTPEEALGN